MFSKIIKFVIPSIVAIIIIYLYIKYVTSVDLAIKYSIFPLILGFLFYYDFTLAIIATVIFSVIFIYNMKYSKKISYRKKTSKFKVNDITDNEYDYYVNNEQLNNDDTSNEDANNDDMHIYPTVEGMSNKGRNRGVDRISAEQNIRSKESNTLLISKDFASKEKTEPISVGKDGTVSGYALMDANVDSSMDYY
jgi:predicted membrane protein